MLKEMLERIRQGHRTIRFPDGSIQMPDRFRGRPIIDQAKCAQGCRDCAKACPTGALLLEDRGFGIDLGRCLFCTDCAQACPRGAIQYSADYRLAAGKRDDLIVRQELKLAQALDWNARKLFGRSLKLRQVSAGGCNACEADVNVLNTLVFDLGRFGVQFVASPRHADGLLITGPVTQNMKSALLKTVEAVPSPKIVIAAGSCAISGGPYAGHPEQNDGTDPILPVDLYIPGCPPHPLTILDGILRLLGKIKN
jgi:Ni,Fe-hydrogenase III small subunit/NAD-dependent dihydropyrimidine dehydrogenase PreA subunit